MKHFCFFITLAILRFYAPLYADPSIDHRTGFIPPTEEEIAFMEENWPQIIRVIPNKLGNARMEISAANKKSVVVNTPIAEEIGIEFITNKNESNYIKAALPSEENSLPSYVDNSILPSFPYIGDQGNEGSCTAFASTYYHATHEIGLLNGYNNKLYPTNVLSPKWSYNLLNNGVDAGIPVLPTYNLLAQSGAVPIWKLPYVAGDFLSWDLNPSDWILALSYRLSPPMTLTGLGGSSQNLTTIKQLLNNGHVLTFATYATSWQYTTVPNNPQPGADNQFAGQKAVSWMSGRTGPHYVTIVGYNDNLWIDVNQNGQVDAGEMGAFLVANSWGTNWANRGFIWISYDAFLGKSAVAGGPSLNRFPLASALYNYAVSVVPKAPNYTPTLVAQFQLTATQRNQIKTLGGISNTSSTSPSAFFTPGILQNQGGPFRFDGTASTTPQSGSFAIDLTDLRNSNPSYNNRFYLALTDTIAGNPTTLDSFALIDVAQGAVLKKINLPQTVDASTISPYIDDVVPSPPIPVPPQVTITYPPNNSLAYCTLPVSVNVFDNVPIKWVLLYVDTTLLRGDSAAPYTFLVDTTTLSNGRHLLKAVAINSANQSTVATAVIQVHNGCP